MFMAPRAHTSCIVLLLLSLAGARARALVLVFVLLSFVLVCCLCSCGSTFVSSFYLAWNLPVLGCNGEAVSAHDQDQVGEHGGLRPI